MLRSALQIGNSRTKKKKGTAECAGNTLQRGQQLCYNRGQQIVANFCLKLQMEVLVVFFLFEMTKLMQSGVKKSDNTLNSLRTLVGTLCFNLF